MEFDYELCETLSDIPPFKGVDLHEYTSLQKGEITYLPRINATPLEKRKVIKIHETKFLRILDQEQHEEWIQEVPNHFYRLREDNVIQITNIHEKWRMWAISGISKDVYQELDAVEAGLNGIGVFNDSTEVIVREIFGPFKERIHKNNSEGVSFKTIYKIHVIILAEGSISLPGALISLGEEPVQLGTQDMFLKPLGEDTKKILKEKPIYD
ncbi:hypothetical protein KA005_00480, partial [bacterium]|nr:hypothetical protein [bacterium]